MTDHTLPHAPYITTITDALTAASLEPAEWWVDDAETRGTYCHLNAVITLDPSGTIASGDEDARDATPWAYGLLLIWEWHTGLEEGGPERGPLWQFAKLNKDGSNEYPTDLPVHGYASPDAVVDAARKVISREIGAGGFHNYGSPSWNGGIIGDSWERAKEVDAACETWGVNENTES